MEKYVKLYLPLGRTRQAANNYTIIKGTVFCLFTVLFLMAFNINYARSAEIELLAESNDFDAYFVDADWATAHDAIQAEVFDNTDTNEGIGVSLGFGSTKKIVRAGFEFDLTYFTDQNILSATLYLHADISDNNDLIITQGTFSDLGTSSDYSAFLDVEFAYTPSVTSPNYNALALNSAGIEYIQNNLGNSVKFFAREKAHDYDDIVLTVKQVSNISFSENETDQHPYLVINYASSTPPATSPESVPCNYFETNIDDISIISACSEVWGESTTTPESTIRTFYYSPFLLFFYIVCLIWTSIMIGQVFISLKTKK